MQTISQQIRAILLKNPSYGEALGRDIVNFRALARVLRKEVEEARMERVSEEAVAIALRRIAPEMKKRLLADRSVQPVKNLSIRRGVSLFVFEHSPALSVIHQKLLKDLERNDASFLHFTQGMRDTTFVISDDIAPRLEVLASKEKILKTYATCSVITVMFPRESLDYPGVCERYFRALAWEGVSVVDFILSNTELSFIVEEKDAKHAYDTVNALTQ